MHFSCLNTLNKSHAVTSSMNRDFIGRDFAK